MSSIPSNLARVSSGMSAALMLSNLQQNNIDLLNIQEQISTGQRVNRPSDDASVVAQITTLLRVLEQDDQTLTNLTQAEATINTTDHALSDVSNLLLEAQTIASSQVGIGSDPVTRANQAQVIVAQIDELLRVANRELNDIHLFAGESSSQTPFVDFAGGIQYIGSRDDLATDLGLGSGVAVNTNGVTAFGGLSARVQSAIDLDPDLYATTRLVDINGARGLGVTLGSVTVTVDGSPTDVDLTGADTIEDITDRISDAIGVANGVLLVIGDSFQLIANPGHTVSITDIGQANVAADLGIDIVADASASAVPVLVAGTDVDPHVTELTQVGSITAPFDTFSGMTVTNGSLSGVIDFTGAVTVQEMINIVDAAQLGIRLEISEDNKTLRLVNEISGTELSVGENGGTTATDLGLRTFDTTTALAELNFDKGINTATGNDLRIHLHDGSDIYVDLSAAVTVGDVITAINTAGGGSVTAAFVPTGNGIQLTDATVGADAFAVFNEGQSNAATDLGIRVNAGAAATLSGSDVAKVRVESVFTHLMMLRDGLLNDDEKLITEAGSLIASDITTVATARAKMGVRAQRVNKQITRVQELTLQNQSLLSDVRDIDLNEAITRFTQLQQQLQANLLVGQQNLSLSLLDFLR